MENRPRITIEPGYWDRVLDSTSWALFVLMLVISIYVFINLPDQITLHSDLTDNNDSFGDKALVLLLPGIAIVLFTLMKILMRHPHRFNYLIKITPENAVKQYTVALRMMRLVTIFLLLELIIVIAVIFLDENEIMHVSPMLIVISSIVLGFVPLIYYLWALGKK